MVDSQRLARTLRSNRQSVLSVVITASLLGALVAFAAPSAAVSTFLTGPDEVERTERVAITGTVDIETGERVPVEAFVLQLRPRGDEDESVAITFAPNGTVLDVDPARGVVGERQIRVNRLKKSLDIEIVALDAPYSYGARSGADRNADQPREFGYGYGYGYGYGSTNGSKREFQYRITFDAQAFKHGDYAARMRVDTGSGVAFASEPLAFEVTVPADDRGPNRDDPSNAPDDDDDDRASSPRDGPPARSWLQRLTEWVRALSRLVPDSVVTVNATVHAGGSPLARLNTLGMLP